MVLTSSLVIARCWPRWGPCSSRCCRPPSVPGPRSAGAAAADWAQEWAPAAWAAGAAALPGAAVVVAGAAASAAVSAPAAAAISAAAARRETGEAMNCSHACPHRAPPLARRSRRARARSGATGLERLTRPRGGQRTSATAARSASASRPACRCHYLWRGATARERAVTLFGKLRVWDTEHNNGVLIYLLLAEHAIEIVADRGHRAARVDAARMAAPSRSAWARRFARGASRMGSRRRWKKCRRCWCAHFPLADGRGRPERAA